jgi:hypothetical protein
MPGRLREKGKSEEYIAHHVQKYRTMEKRNQYLVKTEDKPGIKWSCDEELFDIDGETMDVAMYFQRIYDKPIRFPNLPIVLLCGGGYIPVEFLFYEKCKVPNADSPAYVNTALGYHDLNAGIDRVNHVRYVYSLVCM